jgi:hypothetical protein
VQIAILWIGAGLLAIIFWLWVFTRHSWPVGAFLTAVPCERSSSFIMAMPHLHPVPDLERCSNYSFIVIIIIIIVIITFIIITIIIIIIFVIIYIIMPHSDDDLSL